MPEMEVLMQGGASLMRELQELLAGAGLDAHVLPPPTGAGSA